MPHAEGIHHFGLLAAGRKTVKLALVMPSS